MGLFNRIPVDGRSLRLDPEVEAECYRIYWAERTWGMTDEELMRYLTRPGCPLVIDVLKTGEREGLH